MNILVSSCLLGTKCRYDGSCALCNELLKLKDGYNFISVCPEVLSGLPTPREPCEIFKNRVVTKSGKDFTSNFIDGANQTLEIAKSFDCKYAILKERSPSCGNSKIYDGKFSGKLVYGTGVTASLLAENGIIIFSENEIDKFVSFVK